MQDNDPQPQEDGNFVKGCIVAAAISLMIWYLLIKLAIWVIT